MKNLFILSISLLFISCNSGIKNTLNDNQIERTIVTKFMGAILTQPPSVNEDFFWNNWEEHATMTIRNTDIIEDIKSMVKIKNGGFDEMDFAFIVHTKSSVDTIYSDYLLERWTLKVNGSFSYYKDDKKLVSKKLKESYSFFNNCW